MKSKILAIFLWGGILVSQAQTQRVGINTEDPKFTLDVKGTMRIGDPDEDRGQESHNFLPLGWNPQNNQVVKLRDKTFYKVNFSLTVNDDDGKILSLDTGIDSKKYTAIVTQSILTIAGNGNLSDESTVRLNLLSMRNNTSRDLEAVRIEKGGHHVRIGNYETGTFIYNQTENQWRRNEANYHILSSTQLDHSITSDSATNTLKLTAQYPHVKPTHHNGSGYTWHIELLVMNKQMLK